MHRDVLAKSRNLAVVLASLCALTCSAGANSSRSDDVFGNGGASGVAGLPSAARASGPPQIANPAAAGTASTPTINVNVPARPAGGEAGSGPTCSAENREGQRVPVDMYFLVDSSLSMNDPVQGGTRWNAVSSALIDFLNDPRNADTALGIGYFPQVPSAAAACVMGDPNCLCLLGICIPLSDGLGSCMPADYSSPAVPLALPANLTALINDVRAHRLNGGTPTRPALEGALQYLSSWAVMHPDRKPVMVLATDGEPLGCTTNTPRDVANVAAAALAANIPIQTFVIGVGNSLQSLNLIAQAGGTTQAFLVEDDNAATAFAEALERIRGVASPCDFAIPSEDAQGRVDPQKVNVKYTPTGASQPALVLKTFDGTAAGCGPDGGWYYDRPQAPTTITLCPVSCEALGGGSIQVEFGCQTIVQPPR